MCTEQNEIRQFSTRRIINLQSSFFFLFVNEIATSTLTQQSLVRLLLSLASHELAATRPTNDFLLPSVAVAHVEGRSLVAVRPHERHLLDPCCFLLRASFLALVVGVKRVAAAVVVVVVAAAVVVCP